MRSSWASRSVNNAAKRFGTNPRDLPGQLKLLVTTRDRPRMVAVVNRGRSILPKRAEHCISIVTRSRAA